MSQCDELIYSNLSVPTPTRPSGCPLTLEVVITFMHKTLQVHNPELLTGSRDQALPPMMLILTEMRDFIEYC